MPAEGEHIGRQTSRDIGVIVDKKLGDRENSRARPFFREQMVAGQFGNKALSFLDVSFYSGSSGVIGRADMVVYTEELVHFRYDAGSVVASRICLKISESPSYRAELQEGVCRGTSILGFARK